MGHVPEKLETQTRPSPPESSSTSINDLILVTRDVQFWLDLAQLVEQELKRELQGSER